MTQKVAKKRSSEPSAFGKLYLLAYNSIQTLGWSYLLWQTLTHFLNRGTLDTFWDDIKWTVIIFQNAAILEENLTKEILSPTIELIINENRSVTISVSLRNRCRHFFPSLISVMKLHSRKTSTAGQRPPPTHTVYHRYLHNSVVHAAVGLVPSSVAVVLMQVYSRVFLVCGALLAARGAALSPGLPLAILAWAVTEIIRYGYYALNLYNAVPQFLLFLRYSTFLVLYPLGITGELLCMYHSLEEVDQKKLFTYSMPNEWNFAFNYYYFLIFYMFLYIPLFPVLFGHMLSQRRKMLGKNAKTAK